ncbi:conserved hypothetical protein [Gloeothece citriformis PCC 7424]|uniref:Uncharacterized protein n=1 Tax=Gloeothece citriformis (strain PCC 7424) TaxID=65393 RepID=B7K7B0_GLOC7|nr:hypothetical protein [Gloeothece citriformis]ACK69678.1 conserved hypothetical protein [Gloeothece citriformis PCC 7424]
MDNKAQFKLSQIVCLEHKNTCLYGEVVQVITPRNLCWVRPIILAKLSLDSSRDDYFMAEKEVIDVRLTSDLIFPIDLFRPALDMEVIPILAQVEKMDLMAENISSAKSELQNFIKQIWSKNS